MGREEELLTNVAPLPVLSGRLRSRVRRPQVRPVCAELVRGACWRGRR